jgi:hypothetical protein
MGTYVTFRAKPGCEDQINEACAAMTGLASDFLVFSDKIIRSEIEFIHSPEGDDQKHLRPYLKTVSDWNKVFPVYEPGTGNIKISALQNEDVSKVRQSISFLIRHRDLFSEVKGLRDARYHGLTPQLQVI